MSRPSARPARPAWGLLLATLLAAGAARADLPLAELGAGMYRIEAEVAATPDSRETGLMRRPMMAQQRGMVFVFPQQRAHCMWMKNTLIPLSVAFLDAEGAILNIEDMQPQSEQSHCAAGRARFALEMNLGWFAAKGIKAGARIRGVDRLPPPR
jgi:uncharacterized membrane protein (UPF0127 family)